MLPLHGVRVLEFCHVAAGPYAGMLLSDMGADVVKVEGPTGDQMRGWPPLEEARGGGTFSHNFASINRNKRSVCLDLKTEGDRATARALIDQCDVLLENYRPGMLKRFGLGYSDVADGHPGLIYCSVSGFGQSGPLSSNAAYDVVIQGMSGLMSVTGETDGPPVKSGVPVADFVAGLYAAYSIAALLPQVKESGTSTQLDVPMLDCLLGASALQASEHWGSGRDPQRMGSRHPRNAPYQAFDSADAPFVIAAGSNRLWWAVCDIVERQDLKHDPRFDRQQDRAANQLELEQILKPLFLAKPASHWLDRMSTAGVPCGPVSTFGEVLSSPHVEATGLVELLETAEVGTIPSVAFPVLLDGSRLAASRPPPALGAHNREVLREWLG